MRGPKLWCRAIAEVFSSVRQFEKRLMAITEITNARHGCRETIVCRVRIPADLSHTGEERWDDKPVDKCLAPVVDALNRIGCFTDACCCGHGKATGSIHLHDGTVITVPKCAVVFVGNDAKEIA